jgi:hypothetical protein
MMQSYSVNQPDGPRDSSGGNLGLLVFRNGNQLRPRSMYPRDECGRTLPEALSNRVPDGIRQRRL